MDRLFSICENPLHLLLPHSWMLSGHIFDEVGGGGGSAPDREDAAKHPTVHSKATAVEIIHPPNVNSVREFAELDTSD